MDASTRPAAERLADELRRIIARLTVVRPPAEELAQAADAAAAFADRLDQLQQRPRSWEVSEAGLQPRDFMAFSPVSGHSNPMAPPARFRVADTDTQQRVEGEVTFGPAYEGPPGHVHGGWLAAVFDELLGFTQRGPGFTAYLHVDYRKPTPLDVRVDLVAWIASVDGRKRLIRGEARHGDLLLAEAEGLFVSPRGEDILSWLGQRA